MFINFQQASDNKPAEWHDKDMMCLNCSIEVRPYISHLVNMQDELIRDELLCPVCNNLIEVVE